MMKNVTLTITQNLIKKIYIICFTIIVLLCLFSQFDKKKTYLLDNSLNIIFGISVYVIFAMILARLITDKIKEWNRIMIVLTILLSFGLFILSYQYCFRTGWDVDVMLRNASFLASGEVDKLSNHYYSRCPNNVFLTCVFSLAYKIANLIHVEDGYFILLAVQSCVFAWSGYFIYRIADMFFLLEKRNYSFLVWFIYLLLVGLSPWIVIPYSDSIALFMVTLCTFLFFKMCEGEYTNIFLFLFVLFGIIGYYIKPQIFILIIAFFIITLLNSLKKISKYLGVYVKKMGIVLLAVIIAIGTVNIVKEKSGFDLDKEAQLGITHFFMMGWNKETGGIYYQSDVDYSISFPTKKERAKANIKVAKERLQDFGIIGIIKFICNKTLINYNNGTFAWGGEGNFYMKIDKTGYQPLRKILSEYYYHGGKYYICFKKIMQILWMGTIFLNIFTGSKRKDSRIIVLMLSILGLTLFETLFEARARYLFAYVPIYIFLAAIGLSQIESFYRKHLLIRLPVDQLKSKLGSRRGN